MDVAPGWVDLQVNGGWGIDFSSPSLTRDDIALVSARLAACGVKAFCPTVITTDMATYRHVLPLLARVKGESLPGASILGVHLEGPFISPLPGARGAHPVRHIVAPCREILDELVELARQAVRLITLAPEEPGGMALAAYARSLGVMVGMGHTMAEAGAVREAVSAGVTLSTHLGNGLPNLIHRHENPVWAQLAEPGLTAMLIADGHHVPLEFIRTAFACKGPDKIILTADACPVAGCGAGDYDALGTRVRLMPDGRVVNLNEPTLAGSGCQLDACLRWLSSRLTLAPEVLDQIGRRNALAAIAVPCSRTTDCPDRGVSVTYGI